MLYRWEWIGALLLLARLSVASKAQSDFDEAELANDNHIFNAIHSSLRHWGTSIYPNGMGFYLASVPKGTRFYHGTGQEQAIKGVEWLAFRPEHSLGFAHRGAQKMHKRKRETTLDSSQQVLDEIMGSVNSDSEAGGYLHTYEAAKDLRLLYVDGMSAGPGSREAYDSQDLILFNDSIGDTKPMPDIPVGGPPSEKQRAYYACRLAQETWGDKIDGLVRTEADFEIILCNFERDLEVVHITQTKPGSGGGFPGGKPGKGRGPGGPKGPGGPGGPRGPRGPSGDYLTFATRFDELMGEKVVLDFDNFVTAYTYGLDLFPNNAALPQLRHIPMEQLAVIRNDINTLVDTRKPSLDVFDWRSVADAIVFRYSDELQSFASGNFSSLEALRQKIEQRLEPFIDYRDAGSQNVVGRCSTEFTPSSAPVGSLGGRAVRSISRKVCSTMVSALFDQDMNLEKATVSFQELVSFLGWTTWYNRNEAVSY